MIPHSRLTCTYAGRYRQPSSSVDTFSLSVKPVSAGFTDIGCYVLCSGDDGKETTVEKHGSLWQRAFSSASHFCLLIPESKVYFSIKVLSLVSFSAGFKQFGK